LKVVSDLNLRPLSTNGSRNFGADNARHLATPFTEAATQSVSTAALVDYAVGRDVVKAANSMMAPITPDMMTKWTNTSPRDWANET
jgi:hypothetical protein